MIYYHSLSISWAQVYPFIFYQRQLADRFDVEVRALPVEDFLAGRDPKCGWADIVLVQPWFTVDPTQLANRLAQAKERHKATRFSFVDSYAHSDVRLGKFVNPYIEFYFKKSLFLNRTLYQKPFNGDTSLTDYYGALYELEQPLVDWEVPASLNLKLRLSPNFFTAPRFLNSLNKKVELTQRHRKIDVQTRIGQKGSRWYSAMRSDASQSISNLKGITASPSGTLNYRAFMQEMRHSKICFSPFGYGELCWRDIEAMVSGAVLVKPDMSHMETLPNLYEPDMTYVPVKWDFSDLETVVTELLSDENRQRRISEIAYRRMAKFVQAGSFLDQVKCLF